jgi:protein-tyrosine phosphatase
MVDLHSHVLYGLDDGARSIEESVAMVRVAAAAGTTDLVATPHANIEYRFDPDVVEARLAEVAAASGNAVRLHYGCDFHFYYENIQQALAHPARYTIAHRNYLLVEFPDLLIPSMSEEIFSRLLDRGITPVVTHPERNFLLHTRLKQMEEWVADGVLMQVTAQSFLGRFGPEVRRFADQLMRRGMVHVVASDGHSPEDRPPRLDEGFAHVSRAYGEDWARALFIGNPRSVLEGEPLPEQPPPATRRQWYAFWK